MLFEREILRERERTPISRSIGSLGLPSEFGLVLNKYQNSGARGNNVIELFETVF